MTEIEQSTARPVLPPDTRVEVCSGLDGSWQRGFVIEAVTERGYLLRRDTDGAVLPEVPATRVRRPRTRQTWWI